MTELSATGASRHFDFQAAFADGNPYPHYAWFREHDPVHAGERRTGVVTSGTQSPTIGSPIAMAYVATADAEPGTVLDVEIRDQRVPARVVPLPFYSRASS